MSLPEYALRLAAFARARAVSKGSWQEMLSSLCPEFLAAVPPELANCDQPAMLSMFSALVFQIGQELQELSASGGDTIRGERDPDGYRYQVQALTHRADLGGLIELWRFGVALELDAVDLEVDVLEKARLVLKKDIQGAWRVAQRRWKSFSKASGKLNAAGTELKRQARRVESALSVALSEGPLICSRADLATDWLAGIDLWLHRPRTTASKGQGLALSLLKSRQVEQKKAARGAGTLWTPHSLADRLVQELGASGAETAQHLWEALGKPGDLELTAQRLRTCLLDLATLGRGVHPSAHAPELVRWLRRLQLETK